MRSFTLFAIIIFLFLAESKAQVIEKTVAVAPVSFTNRNSNRDNSSSLYNYIINSLKQTKRIKVIDRLYSYKDIVEEIQLQKGGGFYDSEALIRQGKQLGAEYILTSFVNMATTNEARSSKTNELLGYEATLSLFVRIINVETGEVIESAIISPKGVASESTFEYSDPIQVRLIKGLFTSVASTPEQAMLEKMAKIEPYIREFINNVFPLEMRIADVQETIPPKQKNKKNPKSDLDVFIIGGLSTGLKVGDVLKIIETKTRVIGEKQYVDDVEIGKMKVIRISEDLVVSRITIQSKTVINEFKENADNLKVVFIPRNGIF